MKIETLPYNILAQKSISIAGVLSERETGCNQDYKKFKESDYLVYAFSLLLNSHESGTSNFRGCINSHNGFYQNAKTTI